MKNLFLSVLIIFFNLHSKTPSQGYHSTYLNLNDNFDILSKFQNAEFEFQQRWQEFENNNDFPFWNSDWKEEELKARFEKMMEQRWKLYFINPEDILKKDAIGIYRERYKTPKNWESWHSRYPYPGSFSYNLAISDYNASIITLHGMRFIVMEAPSYKNLHAFYRLISTYKLSHLVRLTPNFELGRESCFSYWKKGMNIDPLTKGATIEISGKKIHYFPIENWKNHEGYGSEKLLSLVKEVMKGPDPKMIGVHCRAGVGRSGTFIAAYTLIHDIDKQIANSVDINHLKINIDQVVWELSLQRPFMVCHFAQYLTLYKLINYYMTILKFNSIQETISLEFN